MAFYDVDDMEQFLGKDYLALREDPIQTQRERDLRPQIDIDRRSYDFVKEWKGDDFKKVEDVSAGQEGNKIVATSSKLKEASQSEELDKWFDEEHVPMLRKVPGWRRSRRFNTSSIDKKDETDYLAMHEFAPGTNLGGPEAKAASSTQWAQELMQKAVAEFQMRVYSLYYNLGPAPRELSAPAQWDSPATMTRTFPPSSGSPGAVESYITTEDGAQICYRLEGSPDREAPLVVLSNSILTTWGIWDKMVAAFFSTPQNKDYRLLRYHTRGRTSAFGKAAGGITVDLLASDIVALLDALRVHKAALVVGVSLGGATVLNVGLNHPDRVERFLSCDTNAKSPAGNSKAWKERIAMAEKEDVKAATGEPIVGSELAEVTVKRWDGGNMGPEFERVKEMVRTNSLAGFSESVKALWEYDMEALMKDCKVKGHFLVGGNDGVLPGTMKKMAEQLAGGAECTVIEGAGHLPMVEKPQEVADVISKILTW